MGGASAGEMPALTLSARLSLQHAGNPEVLVEFGPVNAHRHQFEAPARRGTGLALNKVIEAMNNDVLATMMLESVSATWAIYCRVWASCCRCISNSSGNQSWAMLAQAGGVSPHPRTYQGYRFRSF